MKGKTTLILLSVIFVIILLTYFPILNSFFQQDEWASFSQFFVYKSVSFKELLYFIFTPSVMHFSPFTVLLNFISFYLFGLNYHAYSILSLLGHLLTTYLVFYLSKILLKNIKLAFFCALIFGVLVSNHQAVVWLATSIPTQWATIFGVLSIIIFFKNNRLGLYLLPLSLFISLFFKETTVGLFLLFPIAIMLFKKTDKNKWVYLRVIVFSALLYTILRGSMFLLPRSVGTSTVFETQSLAKIVYNFTTVPIKIISQSILPADKIRFIAEEIVPYFRLQIVDQKSSPEYEVFLTEHIMEALSLILSIILILLSVYVFAKNKENYLAKIMAFGFIWIIVNSFIISFAPEKSGTISIIDSRYFYFVSVGTVLYLVSFTYLLLKNKRNVFIILFLLTVLNVFWLGRQLLVYVKEGTVRKRILNIVKQNYPKLPAKIIFYTENDSSYYGLSDSERILPFQSGFGQTLLVWYYATEKFPKEFFTDRFLWEILDQGYKEVNNRGFGYFRDFDKLVETLENEKLPIESVISFRYDSDTQILTDNTDEVRERLLGYFSNKKEISLVGSNIVTDLNSEKTSLMLDRQRNTFWDSKLPYALPQFIQIKLSGLQKIAMISIDSYNNKDQNEVGYAIYLSNDGKVWERAFYSKRYPPGEDGIINIYLLPKYTRFVKIQQIGYHKYASWVIHELKIYEAKN